MLELVFYRFIQYLATLNNMMITGIMDKCVNKSNCLPRGEETDGHSGEQPNIQECSACCWQALLYFSVKCSKFDKLVN